MCRKERRRRRKDFLKAADGGTPVAFWRMGMPDVVPRNCKFCGFEFVPGQQEEIASGAMEAGRGGAWWWRTACSSLCAGMSADDAAKARRRKAIASTSDGEINRFAVFQRDGYRCYLCGRQTAESPSDRRPQLDHVVPLCRGGTHTMDNVRCACQRCNLTKGHRTLSGVATVHLVDEPMPQDIGSLAFHSWWRRNVLEEE